MYRPPPVFRLECVDQHHYRGNNTMRSASRTAILVLAVAIFGSAALAQELVIDGNAHAVERVEPVWPVTPVSDSYGGTVSVVVSLDNAGNVMSVEPADGPGAV